MYSGTLMNQGQATLENVTFSGNKASSLGGGIYNNKELSLTNVTITGNIADSDDDKNGFGGGIVQEAAPSKATLKNTLIAGNFKGTKAPTPDDCSGTIDSVGHNLIQTTIDCLGMIVGIDLINIDPNLDPVLQPNGSAFNTSHALFSGSPAIDAGDNTGCPKIDQRGVSRPQPQGGACDIGAYEVAPELAITQDLLDFSTIVQGKSSEPKPIGFVNMGGQPFTITSITSSDPAFTIPDAAGCIGQTLQPGPTDQCNVHVIFTPKVVGTVTANLSITTNPPVGNSFTLPQLTGIGVASKDGDGGGGGSKAAFSINPTSLSFSDIILNTSSAPSLVTLTSSGTLDLTLTGLSLSGGNAAEFTLNPGTCEINKPLATNTSCTLNVVFHPTSAGIKNATLQITSNAPDASVPIVGNLKAEPAENPGGGGCSLNQPTEVSYASMMLFAMLFVGMGFMKRKRA